ncbi:cyclophilin-like protein [Macrolepiota fuliginosa MF-IS2]|uniref:Cyclophilin-like protein n=1 Tax=Macrolepiota fuliginosa MF-IS2 TaxID=1400762 RepID=A0A9P5XIW8_9AGAR|nr:cyclophilin-like protein [Macrolepiota fuliginosa MF-IS2]
MALPTKGRVIIDTTAGEIDIELWSKETPKTCRNFLALAMEGYYDNVIFHRVVPGFLVQTGDKTGTGAGGESFYGDPFEDEIHPRLRFAHRGLVAMANNGTRNSNDSQFFITLDRADELQGKHTLFGRVMGDTVYNVMKIGETEIDKKTERPIYPPKIQTIRIIDNPFPDIVPRITAAERREQLKVRQQAQREREEADRRKGAKKNTKLLSFGADEDAEEEPVVFAKKSMFRPDLVDNPTSGVTIPSPLAPLSAPTNQPNSTSKAEESKTSKSTRDKELDITKIREQHANEQAAAQNSRRAEIEKMEAEIRKITKRKTGEDSDEESSKKKVKKSYLEEELSKYAKGRGLHKKAKDGRKKDESDVLAALNSFRGRLQGPMVVDDLDDEANNEERGDTLVADGPGEEAGIEVDNDTGFLGHALHFPKDNTEETDKAERDYEVIDPRQRGARAREEERERKKLANKGKGGGRYRR